MVRRRKHQLRAVRPCGRIYPAGGVPRRQSLETEAAPAHATSQDCSVDVAGRVSDGGFAVEPYVGRAALFRDSEVGNGLLALVHQSRPVTQLVGNGSGLGPALEPPEDSGLFVRSGFERRRGLPDFVRRALPVRRVDVPWQGSLWMV